jgi:hypothetical protein
MWQWIRHLDRLLRGQATQIDELKDGKLNIPIFGLAVVIDILGLVYGACMGAFSLTSGGSGHWMQVPATMLKVPALFLLTLFVTLPSLYVFNAMVGSRLSFASVVRLLIGSLAVTLAVLASIGPIVAFFSLSTSSYHFMVLLNTVVFAISGALGLAFLLQTLHRMTIANAPVVVRAVNQDSSESETAAQLGPIDPTPNHVLGPHVKTVFRIWVIVFCLVGSQMGWILRPFIGSPDQPFVWFRPRSGDFFHGVINSTWHLVK